MSNLINFKSRRELSAQENLDAFISFARDELVAFGTDLPFDSVVWDVTDDCAGKGKGSKRERITFSTLDSASSSNPVSFSEKFLPFAQAYMRQAQALKKNVNIAPRLQALRAIEAALVENHQDLSTIYIDDNILNRAAQIAKNHYSKAQAYRVGQNIEIISEFITKKKLSVIPLQWRNPIKRSIQSSTRVGPEFDQKRLKMMPTAASLEALAYIFQHATEPRDVLVSSVGAILCSIPSRISEVLMLPVNCETPGAVEESGVYGLRWWPAKGGDPGIKWVLPSMVDVVREAIRKITELTNPAREVALWYEHNPGMLYLPSSLEDLRTRDMLTVEEIRTILWGKESYNSSARTWCNMNGVQLDYRYKKQLAYFAELQNKIVSMLPPLFPLIHKSSELTYSKALMVVQKNQLDRKKYAYQCIINMVDVGQINNGLGGSRDKTSKSIYDSFSFFEDDGSRITHTTHKFRHYLNSLAQAGGLSQLDIAKWSGRKDIRQNEAYDHVSAQEMLQIIRESVGDISKVVGPLATIPKQYLIRRDEFSRLIIPTAHTTDIGYCIHDYTMTPCLVHLDCINCQEHVYVKGDSLKTARLRQNHREAEDLLCKAEAAVKSEYFGSDRWLEHHKLTTERLRQLCEIMNDPEVSVRSIIQLNNVKSASRIEQVAIVRAQLAITKGNQSPLLKTFKQSDSARTKRKDD